MHLFDNPLGLDLYSVHAVIIYLIANFVIWGAIMLTLFWPWLRVGTKSVLIGAHAFWYHPFAVAMGWWSLYGFPWHPGLWVCFLVHDIGYFGSPNMDGPEGEKHPEIGARIAKWLTFGSTRFYEECLYHSRHYAKVYGRQPSRLCMADKLAPVYTPAWLYLWGVSRSGELAEYMANGKKADWRKTGFRTAEMLRSDNPKTWYAGLRRWMIHYAHEHKDGKIDQITEIRHE